MRRVLTWGIVVAFGCVALILTAPAISSAQVGVGTPTIYKVTIKKVAFSTDDDVTATCAACVFTTVAEQDLELDIASVGAGVTLGDYITGATLANGDYKRMQVTISCTFKLRGQATVAGVTYWTTAAGGTDSNADPNLAAPAEGPKSIPAAACPNPPGTFTGTSPSKNDPNPVLAAQAITFRVAGKPITALVDFDVTNAMDLSVVELVPGSPTITMKIQ